MALHTSPPRTTSAQRTLIVLLLIPLLSLVGLWVFAASVTLGNVNNYQHYSTVNNTTASVVGLEQSLETEHALTLAALSAGRQSAAVRVRLTTARRGTDSVAAVAETAMTSVRGLLNPTAQAELTTLFAELNGLGSLRAEIDSGADTLVTANSRYSAIDATLFGLFYNSSPPADPTLALMTQAGISESRAGVLTAAANGLIGGVISSNGPMTQQERELLGQIVAQQNLETGDALELATPDLAALFKQIFDSAAYQQLTTDQTQIIDAPANSPVPVRAATFQRTVLAIQATEQSVLPQVGGLLAAKSAQFSNHLRTELYLAAGLGLIAILITAFVSFRFGRRLRVELTSLYVGARQMAGERLPRLVERLRRGDDVDVAAESPPLLPGRITEIADVARALSSVQRTAVEAAVGQANLRKGVNQVFVSLSLRNQSLLHRQLGMLDEMERATSDPVALGDLFLLDHLTTRMRRHAEGLLILAGETPGRGWRDPVPVGDVLNAAVAEIEDYVRVDVATQSADFVAGTAVNDVIHLLAELVENATTFSPPRTRVEIRGDSVGHGFAVEIEDRGLGMPAEEIEAINQRLATPPEFDLANTDQLGLFVAAALAARHGIKISLRQSPFGGTTAIVLLPLTIIVPADGTDWTPGAVASPGEHSPASPLAHEADQESDDREPPAFRLTRRHRRDLASVSGHVPQQDPASPALTLLAQPAPPTPPALPAPPAPSAPPARPAPADGGWFSRVQADDAELNGTPFNGAPLNGAPYNNAPYNNAPLKQVSAKAGTRPGLPKRARGTSLAPQLRAKSSSASAADSREGRQPSAWPAAAEPQERSPEEAGSLLSSLQDGWERARIDNLDDFDFDSEDRP